MDTLTDSQETQNETPVSMEDTIAQEWGRISSEIREDEPENPSFNRDESGKFAPKAAETEVAEVVAEEIEAAPAPDVTKQMPASWRKEMGEHWNTLPDPVKDEVIKRENDVRAGFTGYKAKAELGARFEEMAKPYEQIFRQFNVAPEQAAARLFQADHALRFGSPEQKAQMARQIFQEYGIDPSAVFSGQAEQADPRIQTLEQRVAQFEHERVQQAQMAEQEAQQSVINTLADFAYERDASTGQLKTRGADEYGNAVLIPKPGREHFELVRPQMAGLMQTDPEILALLQVNPERALDEAYTRAVYALPTTRQALLAKQAEEQRAEATRKAQAAKEANVVNIRQRGTVPPKAMVGSMDDTIKEAAKALGFLE